MEYHYLIQKTDFYIDEFKDNGEITITNFITEPEYIIKALDLNYITMDRFICFLITI